MQRCWEVGNVVKINKSVLKIIEKRAVADSKNIVRNSYVLSSVADENKKYKYSFAGGLVRIY